MYFVTSAWLRTLAAFLLLALPLDALAVERGAMAPDFHVTTIDGKEISYYSDLRGKKPVYLEFWTTW